MTLLIIGASGMIGSRLTAEALSRGHKVIAAVRNPDALPDTVTGLKLDVTDGDAVIAAAKDADVIIGTVSPRSTGDAAAEMAAIMSGLIKGAEATSKRLIVVGGAGTLNLPDGTPVADVVPEAYASEAKSMRAAYALLEASKADYTFIAPPGEIAPGERTGKYQTGGRTYLMDAEGQSRISAEDYAVALLDEVETPKHKREILSVAY